MRSFQMPLLMLVLGFVGTPTQGPNTGQAFTYAAFIPAGYHDRHSHGSDARIAVVQGSLKVGFGVGAQSDLKSYPVGSFLFVPANVEHTMGADVETIIIGTATGPWQTTHSHSH